jgi:transposase-like protein
MTRPTKYTPERVAAICKDIERGNTFRTAALCNGITYETLRAWREQYPAFSAAIDASEAKGEAAVVQSLGHQIHAGDTKAIIFYLTHRNNDGWRPPKQTSVLEGNPAAPLVVERTVFKPPE